MEFRNERRLFGVMRAMLATMTEGVPDADLYERLVGGGNSPGWVLGHLALGSRFGIASLGGPAIDPDLLKFHGPGSSGEVPPALQRSGAELLRVEAVAAADFISALDAASPDTFRQSRHGLLAREFPLVGDMVAHLLTTHFALHLGQFSAWRRSRGYPSVLPVG